MSTLPVVFPPPAWTNQKIVLYHGTVSSAVASIKTGVRVSLGKPNTDFGPGFYTTTLFRQAYTWAAQIAASKASGPGTAPAVIKIEVSREDLATLQVLAFVRGDFWAKDYWSFVHYCRRGATDHRRPHEARTYYDIVYGPVAAFWNQRMVIADADQVSFHTTDAEKILNRSKRTSII